MSGFAGKFLTYGPLAAPDMVEIGARAALNSSPTQPRRRRRRIGNQENAMSKASPTPAEVQASLNGVLAAYVDGQPTPELKAEALIKIGMYQTEVNQYRPMLKNLEPDDADMVINEWLAGGDAELKKMVFNANAGDEELPLAKIASEEQQPMFKLASLLKNTQDPSAKGVLLQKIATYTVGLRDLITRVEKEPVEKQALAIGQWLRGDDGSDTELKKAIMDAEEAMRAEAGASVGERDTVKEVVGNAATHAGGAMSGGGSPDSGIRRTVPGRSSGEGAGSHMSGAIKLPGQDSAAGRNETSGPNDKAHKQDGETAGGDTSPATRIRRKGTTGGLGSVRGAEAGAGSAVNSAGANDAGAGDGKKKKTRPWEMDKAEFAPELLKFAPNVMVAAIERLDPDIQLEVCEEAAEHGRDLAKWWNVDNAGKLAKAALEPAIAAWMGEDPDTVQLKKWVAEALGTSEEIPLELAKAIMAWQPPAAAAMPRLRQPTHAAA